MLRFDCQIGTGFGVRKSLVPQWHIRGMRLAPLVKECSDFRRLRMKYIRLEYCLQG